MQKTTLYLTDDLALAIKTAAATKRCSEAQVVRSALEAQLAHFLQPSEIDFGMLSRDFGSLGLDTANLDSAMVGFGKS